MHEVNPASRIGAFHPRPGHAVALVVALTSVLALSACGEGSAKPAATSAAPPTRTPSTSPETAPAKPPGSVDVSLKEYTVTPTPTSGRAGSFSFSVHNDGQSPHEFVVVKTPKQASGLAGPGGSGEASEQGNVGETGTVPPGDNKTLSVKLAAGHYVLLCNLPGHYKAGQYVDFTVR
jgi:uncharacterized cupredoxin-like copper-binding protein